MVRERFLEVDGPLQDPRPDVENVVPFGSQIDLQPFVLGLRLANDLFQGASGAARRFAYA